MRPFPSTVLLSLLLAGCVLAPGAEPPVVAVAAPAAAPVDIAAPTDPPTSPPAHLACAVDADCVRVFRRCGSCDCGAPLAKEQVAADAAERDARCRDVLAPVCEMDCRRTTPRCAAGQCALVADVASSPR
jgi:hypothetical protein